MLSFLILSCLILPNIQDNILISAMIILFSFWFLTVSILRPIYIDIHRQSHNCTIKFPLLFEKIFPSLNTTLVVTCGSIPLETSYQRVPRCVYVSTELYEYKGWGGKSANPKHRCLSWGSRYSEKYVADFYVSDFQTGLRALVKAGYGAKVAPFVEPTTVVDVTKENRELSPNFLGWLAARKLSTDDRIMRLKEGYIKEGSTVSVMGVVRRHENVLMIVPPTEPVSTGCQWIRCLLPTGVEGLILTCEDNQNSDVIAV